jgi:hypothetical protein
MDGLGCKCDPFINCTAHSHNYHPHDRSAHSERHSSMANRIRFLPTTNAFPARRLRLKLGM